MRQEFILRSTYDLFLSSRPLFYLMQALVDGEAVHRLMGLLLAFGNYMNSGNCFKLYVGIITYIIIILVLRLF